MVRVPRAFKPLLDRLSSAKVIARFTIDRFCTEGIIRLVGDETVNGHHGKKVYGKARHRDSVRSTHSHTVYRYGHKWFVLAELVDLPRVGRSLALPLLVALHLDKKTNSADGRRHKTPAVLMCGPLAVMMRWLPERKFIFAGDDAYGTNRMCRFAVKHGRHCHSSASSSPMPICSSNHHGESPEPMDALASKATLYRNPAKW